MNWIYVAVSIGLGLSLLLPKVWLHLVGMIGAVILLSHAIWNVGDPAFITIEVVCVIANFVGYLREAFRSARPTVW